jgi:S1-C subfamily serine protease
MFKYLLSSVLILTGCAIITVGHSNKPLLAPKNEREYAKTAVMVTSKNKRAGGTGVILESRPGMSVILTNKHVCQLIQVGGLVITDNGNEYPVESFRVYRKHDLCLVSVFKNLNVNIKVAKKAPSIYSTDTVVGHPALLPTIITRGHFSKIQTIQLIVDMKPCDGSETDDEAIMCIFTGGKPVIKEYQGQITSSLIMPGSSGSAVYNEVGELSGLIFAGSGELSYGILVPWEYVTDFLTNRERYKLQVPNPLKKPENFFTSYFKFQRICRDKTSYVMKISDLCRAYPNLGLWYE